MFAEHPVIAANSAFAFAPIYEQGGKALELVVKLKFAQYSPSPSYKNYFRCVSFMRNNDDGSKIANNYGFTYCSN